MKFIETLAKGAQGALHLGPEHDRVFTDLTPEEKERYKADIHATNIRLQGLPKYIYTLINYYTNTKYIWDNVKMLLEGSELTKDERKDKKDKKKQKQSKTDKKREKTKTRVKNERNQSRISPIQQGRKSKAKIIKPRTNNDKCSKFKGLF
ncbi:hypothetical protein Tco_1116560 [Tanacetum coccineum]